MALTKVTNSMISGAVVNAFDFMTEAQITDVQARTGLVDVTTAIQTAINSLSTAGGVVRLPKGKYYVTAKLTLPNGVSLIGDGQFGSVGSYDQGVTTIYAIHSGTAILSLVGSVGCTVADLCLQSSAAGPYPQSGLLLGRSSAASAGYHKIMRVSVYGSYSVANIYSIASEDNYWEDVNAWNYALSTATNVFYTSIGNSNPSMTEPLTTSSNLDNVMVRCFFVNASPSASAACIYLDNAEGMGGWSFFGGYLTAAAGSYVTIANGAVDGLSALGPFTFSGMNGERLASGDPLYGFRLTVTGSVELRGLAITNCRLDFAAGATHYQIQKASTLTLVAPNIVMQPPEAFPYALVDVFRDKVKGGILSIGREYDWVPVTFEASWSNTLGAPYAQAGYVVEPGGFVSFRGQVTRSIAGATTMFTLPATIRPVVDMFFPTAAGTAVGRILVSSSTGAVSLFTGVTTDTIDLSTIRFNFI